MWDPRIGCAKMPSQAKICKFYVKIMAKISKFLKMRAKRTNICNLYVEFDTEVENKGHWVWTDEKGGQ